ncbi:MAG TPA: hypothetical protein VFY06_01555 [Verrucomicrobiae bacterium]|nr:hypothetical protein [Verrucomicrobiae bacterium]
MKHKSCAASARKPVFPQTLHTMRPNQDKVLPHSKSKKRDNIFSQSRDTREMKNSHNDQTIHAR